MAEMETKFMIKNEEIGGIELEFSIRFNQNDDRECDLPSCHGTHGDAGKHGAVGAEGQEGQYFDERHSLRGRRGQQYPNGRIDEQGKHMRRQERHKENAHCGAMCIYDEAAQQHDQRDQGSK